MSDTRLTIDIMTKAFQDGPKLSGLEKGREEILRRRMECMVESLLENGYQVISVSEHEKLREALKEIEKIISLEKSSCARACIAATINDALCSSEYRAEKAE